MRCRILVLSTDKNWLDNVAEVVADMPHRIEFLSSAAMGWEAVAEGDTDLLLLDLEVPTLERLGWFKLLRQTPAGQRISAILASSRRDEDEVAEAFEHDADDFVAKDCEQPELAARLKAVLRRRTMREIKHEGPLQIGAVTLDLARHQCLVRRTPVPLNPREFQLL